jgi:acetyl esterase/lipase
MCSVTSMLSVLATASLFACGSAPTSPTVSTSSTVVVDAVLPPESPAVLTERTFTAVAYATTSAANVLDLYLPTSGTGPFPVVVFIHGGGFQAGSRNQGFLLAQYLITRGYAVASIDYRLSGEAKFPAQIYDVKAAIRFLRANAVKYALNAAAFATWGESAGAGLAALAGTSGDVHALEDLSQGNSTVSSRVQAAVDLFGPINFLTMDSEFRELGLTGAQVHDSAGSPESRLIGAPVQSRPDLCAMYNPESYISPDDPPFFVQHGSADLGIPYLQGQRFAEKLTAVLGSGRVRWTLFPGAVHSDMVFDTASNWSTLAGFLDTFLRPN